MKELILTNPSKELLESKIKEGYIIKLSNRPVSFRYFLGGGSSPIFGDNTVVLTK